MPYLSILAKNAVFGYFGAIIFLKNYCHVWNQHIRISVIAKFCEETKMPKIGTKKALLGYFWQKCLIWVFLGKIFRKTIVIFQISTLKFVYFQNFRNRQKHLHLGPKMPYLGIFDQRCLIWVFLGKNFKNAIVIFQISTLKFVEN